MGRWVRSMSGTFPPCRRGAFNAAGQSAAWSRRPPRKCGARHKMQDRTIWVGPGCRPGANSYSQHIPELRTLGQRAVHEPIKRARPCTGLRCRRWYLPAAALGPSQRHACPAAARGTLWPTTIDPASRFGDPRSLVSPTGCWRASVAPELGSSYVVGLGDRVPARHQDLRRAQKGDHHEPESPCH